MASGGSVPDRGSGYPSGEVVDAGRPKDAELLDSEQEQQDAASGYASADILAAEPVTDRAAGVEDQAHSMRDPQSGYASADEIEPVRERTRGNLP